MDIDDSVFGFGFDAKFLHSRFTRYRGTNCPRPLLLCCVQAVEIHVGVKEGGSVVYR